LVNFSRFIKDKAVKKYLLFFILLFTILNKNIIEGQSKYFKRAEPKITFGLKTGLNIANQSSPGSENVFESKNLLLFHIGGYYSYRFTQFFIIQPELILTGKGSRWSDIYDDKKDIITYIDLPVMVKYQPVKRLNFQLGLQPGYALKILQKDLKTGVSSDLEYAYNKLDLGLAGGVEAFLQPRLKLTVRYVRGLISATNNEYYDFKCFNNFLQFSVSYRISGEKL
jgi:hypothetical protein